jgi:hypothetical protein
MVADVMGAEAVAPSTNRHPIDIWSDTGGLEKSPRIKEERDENVG